MSVDDFSLRRKQALQGKRIFEDITVVSLETGKLRELLETIDQWGGVNQVLRDPGFCGEYEERSRIKSWRDRLRIKLTLRVRRTTVGFNYEPVDSDDLREVMLDPVSVTVLPDGTYKFVGTHHESYVWERNYNAGYQTEHTYTTYEVTVNGECVTFEITDTKRKST